MAACVWCAQAEAGGVALHLPTAPAVAVKGDERRLRQCGVNLRANAIKFAPDGAVTFSASIVDRTGIEVRIANTGSCIPPEQLERVFLALPSGRQRVQPCCRAGGPLGSAESA